ncbi:UNVERIFIED_CONTAM: hypothetical protein Slati_1835400 [Sesamum latifolium]|uniref:Uncharacterized protein n=1 Tax=Sesamum latifolium TaxID=2727402 RepID=A0AAW2X458_9LAMI
MVIYEREIDSQKRFFSNCKDSEKQNPIRLYDRGTLMLDIWEFQGAVKCSSLSNGDIVVLLQVNVGVEFMRDPILEILQFEKHHKRNPTLGMTHLTSFNDDPSSELLKWCPLEKSLPPRPYHLLNEFQYKYSEHFRENYGIWIFWFSTFLFGHSEVILCPHFAKYESTTAIPKPTAKPSFTQNGVMSGSGKWKRGNEVLLSFRVCHWNPKDFCSVWFGRIFTPEEGERKIEIIQPIEIHSFSVDCNTDNLLCVHVKVWFPLSSPLVPFPTSFVLLSNVSPENAQDIVVFVDSITIIFEEASKGGPPLSLPIACTEAGNDYSLPN